MKPLQRIEKPSTNPSRLELLIVHRPEGAAFVPPHIVHLFAALDCVQLDRSVYTLPTGPGRDDGLRCLAKDFATVGGSIWLFAELGDTVHDDQTYRPLRDCSERYAEAVAAWREGRGALPGLKPGELLRL
ncbi:hypothetical protein [Variovorax paradoxus]|uniref:hypothetical protein n=1 Tax=Variovorax paradoxus TaxID=34073 RepID=UPI0012D3FD64|nr:hypothetical protein [Variovorax paradoxus]